jgi:hypothetical protein
MAAIDRAAILPTQDKVPGPIRAVRRRHSRRLAGLGHVPLLRRSRSRSPASGSGLRRPARRIRAAVAALFAYKLLLVLAQQFRSPQAQSSLRQSLDEEEKMAAWTLDNLRNLTLEYLRQEEMEMAQ